MIESDWLRVQASLTGIWPRRDLEPAGLYLRLLAPHDVEAVEKAIDRLAASSRYAPTPSELLQALLAHATKPGLLERQKAYGEQIVDWLTAKLPEVCKPDPKVVRSERELFGEQAAVALEHSTMPHPAAIAAVTRLHQRHGKGRLSVREHGVEIRDAVRAANRQALRDYEQIAADRASAPTPPTLEVAK